MIHFHKYEEVGRYLMFTGEDRVFYRCKKCGKEKDEYSLDTYYGKANAKKYSEWIIYMAEFKKLS